MKIIQDGEYEIQENMKGIKWGNAWSNLNKQKLYHNFLK